LTISAGRRCQELTNYGIRWCKPVVHSICILVLVIILSTRGGPWGHHALHSKTAGRSAEPSDSFLCSQCSPCQHPSRPRSGVRTVLSDMADALSRICPLPHHHHHHHHRHALSSPASNPPASPTSATTPAPSGNGSGSRTTRCRRRRRRRRRHSSSSQSSTCTPSRCRSRRARWRDTSAKSWRRCWRAGCGRTDACSFSSRRCVFSEGGGGLLVQGLFLNDTGQGARRAHVDSQLHRVGRLPVENDTVESTAREDHITGGTTRIRR